jgi:GNAT superfamily N-acetyltransferase
MTTLLRIKYFQFIEHWRQKGFLAACRFSLYKCEEAVPVVRNLATLRPAKEPAGGLPEILELGPDNFSSYDLHYPLRSRRERVERCFRLGYRSFAMVRDGVVIGDLWYVSRATSGAPRPHLHLRWFGIDLGPDEVYMFDMQVDPKERGNSLTTWFLTSVLFRLRDNDYNKAYGYFAAQNVPALWVHRLIGYEEKPHFVVQRFLLYETAHPKA